MENLVDGKTLAKEISLALETEIKNFGQPLKLAVVTCAPNLETKKFLKLKKEKAESLGVEIEIVELTDKKNTTEVIEIIERLNGEVSGIIVQLPLPKNLETNLILKTIKPELDVDVFSYGEGDDFGVLPPVIFAIAEISKKYQVEWLGKKVVVFGEGRLVGKPALFFAKKQGAEVVLITEKTNREELLEKTSQADIVILGVGKANLLTPLMVKEGVVVFDAGASEAGGVLVGDAEVSVAKKAKLFSPVPGGIGPLTVVLLFKNLLILAKNRAKGKVE